MTVPDPEIADRPPPAEPYLVVTGCTSVYERPFLLGFVPSLFKAGKFRGTLALIDYGLTPAAHALACAYRIELIRPHWYNARRNGSNPRKAMEAMNAYGGYLSDWLRENRGRFTEVLQCDAGDLWFQLPLDGLWPAVRGRVCMLPERHLCCQQWFQDRLDRVKYDDRRRIASVCNGILPVHNGGVIAGGLDNVADYLRRVWAEVMRGPLHLFGIDQLWHNYVIYSQGADVGFAPLPWQYNCIGGWVALHRDDGGLWAREDGERPVVLHNAGNRCIPRLLPDGEDLNVNSKKRF